LGVIDGLTLALPDDDSELEIGETVMVEVECGPETVIWLVTKDVTVERLVEVPSLLVDEW
jgi:hypothetical protein